MKEGVKKLLNKFHLLEFTILIYQNITLIKYLNIFQEIKYRLFGAPDKLPLPPSKLIFKVIGHGWCSIFYNSGKLIVNSISKNLKQNNIELNNFFSILDFGCGCGRLIRHITFVKSSKLIGTDYNKKLINWCSKYLKFSKFDVNNLEPPLKYKNSCFDFIYAQSIFTHLSEKLQIKWLEELYRVLKPGGIFYFSTHGRQFIEGLTIKEKESYKKGEIVVRDLKSQGKNICSTFQSQLFFKNKIKRGFKIVSYIPGKNTSHLKQDVYIFKKTDEPFVFE